MSRNCAPHHSRSRDPTRQCTSPSITKFLRTPYLRTALGNYRATPKAELQAVSGYRLRMSDAMRKSGLSISAPSILQTLPRHCKTCLHMSTGRERDKERERESQRERERAARQPPHFPSRSSRCSWKSPEAVLWGHSQGPAPARTAARSAGLGVREMRELSLHPGAWPWPWPGFSEVLRLSEPRSTRNLKP